MLSNFLGFFVQFEVEFSRRNLWLVEWDSDLGSDQCCCLVIEREEMEVGAKEEDEVF